MLKNDYQFWERRNHCMNKARQCCFVVFLLSLFHIAHGKKFFAEAWKTRHACGTYKSLVFPVGRPLWAQNQDNHPMGSERSCCCFRPSICRRGWPWGHMGGGEAHFVRGRLFPATSLSSASGTWLRAHVPGPPGPSWLRPGWGWGPSGLQDMRHTWGQGKHIENRIRYKYGMLKPLPSSASAPRRRQPAFHHSARRLEKTYLENLISSQAKTQRYYQEFP